MGLFGEKSYLGVDIGTASIKIIEFSVSQGRPELLTYGAVDIKSDILRSDDQGSHEQIIDALKNIVVKSKVKTKKVITALPGFSVFSSVIKLPRMQDSELGSAIRWEARRYVPFPIESMIMDWKKVKTKNQRDTELKTSGIEENLKNETEVLLTAAPKNLVNRYVQIFSKAGLKLIAMETESFALMRALVGNDESTVAIVNIGSTATDINVVSRGLPVLNRSFDTGGRAITNAISNSLSVSMDRAEQFKRDLGTSDNNNAQVPDVMKPIIQNITGEIKNTLSLYKGGNRKIEKIILTGGSSKLPMFPVYIKEALGIEVFLGDPWARIKYPREIKKELYEIAPMFAVSVGLATREIV